MSDFNSWFQLVCRSLHFTAVKLLPVSLSRFRNDGSSTSGVHRLHFSAIYGMQGNLDRKKDPTCFQNSSSWTSKSHPLKLSIGVGAPTSRRHRRSVRLSIERQRFRGKKKRDEKKERFLSPGSLRRAFGVVEDATSIGELACVGHVSGGFRLRGDVTSNQPRSIILFWVLRNRKLNPFLRLLFLFFLWHRIREKVERV